MRISGILYLIQDCYHNIRRNGLMSLAALGTITVSLTVLGASLWTAHRIHEYAQQQPQKFNQIDVFLRTDVPENKRDAIQARLHQIHEIKSIHLVSKEDAWKNLQSNEPTLTEAIEANPLPDKFEIEAVRPGLVEHLARLLRIKKRFPEFAQVNEAGQEIRTMLGLAHVIRVIGVSAALALFAATLFIVQNTIRLTVVARRREIRIMQLVGATPRFIRLPLLLEGLFHGVVGATLASGIILFCGQQVSGFVAQLRSPLVSDVPTSVGPLQVMGGLILIGAFVGLIGSYLSVRRFLKQV